MRARLEVSGLRANVERLDDLGDRARMPEPVLRSAETERILMAGERRKFQRGGWQRDTPAWIKRKRREGLSPRTLVATGRLERALTSLGAEGHNDIVHRAWNGTLIWGIRQGRSDLYYAQPLAKGVRGRRPSRMVVIDSTTRSEIAANVERYIVDGAMA